jgi:hypothetical protein
LLGDDGAYGDYMVGVSGVPHAEKEAHGQNRKQADHDLLST